MAELDLTISTGVTWRRAVVWTDSAGARVSLVGMRAKMEVRQRPGGAVFLTISTAAGTILLEQDPVDGSTEGVLTFIIPGPLSARVSAKAGAYDVKILSDSADGEPSYRLMEGKVTFDLAVTQ